MTDFLVFFKKSLKSTVFGLIEFLSNKTSHNWKRYPSDVEGEATRKTISGFLTERSHRIGQLYFITPTSKWAHLCVLILLLKHIK